MKLEDVASSLRCCRFDSTCCPSGPCWRGRPWCTTSTSPTSPSPAPDPTNPPRPAAKTRVPGGLRSIHARKRIAERHHGGRRLRPRRGRLVHPGAPPAALLPHVAAHLPRPRHHVVRGGQRQPRRRRPRRAPTLGAPRRVRHILLPVRLAPGCVHDRAPVRLARVLRARQAREPISPHRRRPRHVDRRHDGVRPLAELHGALSREDSRGSRRSVLLRSRRAVHRRFRPAR